MGIHIESDIKDYWNRDLKKGPPHTEVFNHISLVWWQQLDRQFHILKPKPTDDPRKEPPFDKIYTLSEHVWDHFQCFWKPGTHLAVNETIECFTG